MNKNNYIVQRIKYLYHTEGWTVQRIATALNISVAAVKEALKTN